MSRSKQSWTVLFVIALAFGLLARIVILANVVMLGTPVADEQHYVRLAGNIAEGNGFAWAPGEPTSIRPPLYPAMLAATWALAGSRSLQAVRAGQIALSLLTAWLVYLLGARLYGPSIGRTAALVFWLYPSLIFFDFLILTETLFTLSAGGVLAVRGDAGAGAARAGWRSAVGRRWRLLRSRAAFSGRCRCCCARCSSG